MPSFEYNAIDIDGRKVKGKIVADDVNEMYKHLSEEDLHCISYKELIESKEYGQQSFSLKTLAMLSRQFATLLGAGVPIVRCFDILNHQTTDKTLKKSLHDVYERVQKGQSLSSALKKEGKLYPKFFINMVKSGEESGNLEFVFDKLASQYSREKELKDKTVSALIYPVILVVVSIAVMILMLVFVIPNFFGMFEGGLDTLPATTTFLLWLSDYFVANWTKILVVTIIAIVVLFFALKTPQVASAKEWLMLKLPVIGKLNAIIISARFAQTLSTLYASGLSLLDALQITQEVINNKFLDKDLTELREKVSKGTPLWKAMKDVDVFPLMLSNMIQVGEETGQLDDMLQKTATLYEEEADVALKRMVALIEPAMIIILAIIIAFVMISIIPPMYSMYKQIG